MARVIFAYVLQPEPLRKIEVELHGWALPLPANCIDELEVELGSIECSAPLVDGVSLTACLQHASQRCDRLLPHGVAAECFVGLGGQLDGVRVAEDAEH